MNKKNEWLDPLFLEDFLDEQEIAIKKNTNKFCNEVLLPNTVKNNRNHFFDDKFQVKNTNFVFKKKNKM